MDELPPQQTASSLWLIPRSLPLCSTAASASRELDRRDQLWARERERGRQGVVGRGEGGGGEGEIGVPEDGSYRVRIVQVRGVNLRDGDEEDSGA
jgi:hypothetical protein